MATQKNLQIVLKKKPDNSYPAVDDIYEKQLVEFPRAEELKENELLVRVQYISIDAAMRVWINGARTYIDGVKPGDVMPAQSVGVVLASRNRNFEAGDQVLGFLRWSHVVVVDGAQVRKVPRGLANPQNLLGVLGIAGQTAYFGLFEIGKPVKGNTVVVSAASGSVGEIVVQLARNHGCRVVAITGSDQKNEYLRKQLQVDACINYKKQDVALALKKECPEGVDVYFDNVGGKMLDDVLLHINERARVVLCGAISQYNTKDVYGLKNYMRLVIKRAQMQGFVVIDYTKRYRESIEFLQKQITAGKLRFTEDIVQGLENAPKALRRLLLGENNGKVIVKVEDVKPKL